MVGENIKDLRIKKGLTQKELADELFVTAQAVSRWENNEVEPSISTIKQMAKIFGVQSDEILGVPITPKTEPEKVVETKYVYQDPQKVVLGVCETCNKPIYDADQIVRKTGSRGQNHVYCKSCVEISEKNAKETRIKDTKKRRIKSYVYGGLFLAASIVIGIFTNIVYGLLIGIVGYTFISCCILNNNFIGSMTLSIFSWGFVKMPGVIFNLSLDGLFWLLTVKLFLWLLGIALAIVCGLLGVAIGSVLSIFVYPFALVKSYKHPDAETNI